MGTTNERRGLTPIRDCYDCENALEEIAALQALGDELTPADHKYIDALQNAVNRYLEYCQPEDTRALPHKYLNYLLVHLKPVSIEELAAEAGFNLTELKAVIEGNREMKWFEKEILVDYFAVARNAFEGPITGDGFC